MISIILYGRNDAHGYNLHRRAALSLNCLAELLTDPDDEIVFADYNTPDELPTFIEAISDTLTDRCLGLLRVLRVPAPLHRMRFASRTHLSALEPVARNAAARRANSANRWLLSTNTDMIFRSFAGESLSEICAGLPDGFYALPRFELPEWIWERLPRSDPRSAIAAVERLGPRLRLNEPTVSYEWIGYDAPGDFQLVLRDDFEAVDGFNEEMLLGWHVDSNLSRRMFVRRGSIESLEGRIAGYHCNHSRVPSIFHDERGIANDLNRFFYGVDRAELSKQRTSWGLADVRLEEVPISRQVALGVADRVASVLPADLSAPASLDARAGLALTYDSGHVLPFVADSLIVSSSDTKVGYVGANPVLQKLLSQLVVELGFDARVDPVDLTDRGSVDAVIGAADVFVIDLGVDASLVAASAPDYFALELPRELERVLMALDRLIKLERARIRRQEHPRRIVLVNGNAAYWDTYVSSNLSCSYTTFHSRVSHATVRPTAAEISFLPRKLAHRMIRWSARSDSGGRRLRLRPGTRVSIANLDDFAGFGPGWAFPDAAGIWTQGRRSDLAVTVDGSERVSTLTLGIGGVCVAPGESLRVGLLVNGEEVASRGFQSDEGQISAPTLRRPLSERGAQRVTSMMPARLVDWLRPLYLRLTAPPAAAGAPRVKELVWRIDLPTSLAAGSDARLALAVHEPQTPLEVGWSRDDRSLGVHLRSLRPE